MPFPALLRRNRKSEVNIRHHSSVAQDGQLVDELAAEPDRPADTRCTTPTDASPGDVDHLRPPSASGRSHGFLGLARFRFASDTQLSARAKDDAAGDSTSNTMLQQPAPAIITTSPTFDTQTEAKVTTPTPAPTAPKLAQPASGEGADDGRPGSRRAAGPDSVSTKRILFDVGQASSRKQRQPPGQPTAAPSTYPPPPPAYGDHSGSSLALPVSRLSESSRSDGSSADRIAFSTTTTTQTVSTTTTIFRLPRRRKRSPLVQSQPTTDPGKQARSAVQDARPPSSAARSTGPLEAVEQQSRDGSATAGVVSSRGSQADATSAAAAAAADNEPRKRFPRRESLILRQQSTNSARSTKSTPTLSPPTGLGSRGRSPTMTSLNDEMRRSTPSLLSGRSSTATTGRSSLGGMFSLSSRLRPSFDSPFPRHGSPVTPSSNTSKPNSFSLLRESVVVPEREADETPAKYLARLQQAVNRGAVAGILARSDDAFSHAVLRSYLRSFAFFEDPIDMAIRKLLMRVELPKETQHIDRVLQKFADRYHECNPGIFSSPDQAYFIAFSLLILQTDAFNKSNKHKMQKHDYIKNTHEYGDGVSEDILACFYDNICYTPFIHVEDDLDIGGGRALQNKGRKSMFPRVASETARKAPKEPIDPYTLIIENRLEFLRPSLKDVMIQQDPYSYLGTAKSLDLRHLQRTFFRWGVLQIVSARSRPDAFRSAVTISNPDDAHPGVVDIRITKVGVLWRKELKKKKTRSPWQEWGAVLTGSQLYFFRNVVWIKSLLQQQDAHQRASRSGSPVVFQPPLEAFKPDVMMPTDDAVALLDSSYRKHKNAFIFVRHGGFEEILLADNEHEVNDWLAKLNYAATFRTAGVRMRAMVPVSGNAPNAGSTTRTDTNNSHASTMASAEDSQIMDGISGYVTPDIILARRQIMRQRIQEAGERLATAQKHLDHQLRNARHLQVLAPIQAKTREQTILAAGRMAAKLKWTRMEMWRLKCHRDILLIDLQDEGVDLGDSADTVEPHQPSKGSSLLDLTQAVGRDEQRANNMPDQWGRHSPPSVAVSHPPDDPVDGMSDALRFSGSAPLDTSRETQQVIVVASDRLSRPEQAYDVIGSRPASSTGQPQLGSVTAPSTQSSPASIAKRAVNASSSDDAEFELLTRAGLLPASGSTTEARRPESALRPDEVVDQTGYPLSDGEGNEQVKVRRSLHRSLRDGHISPHHRHRKGHDSSSSAVLSEDGATSTEAEGLTRGTGSFTLHGKKASVVTFGSEWQAITPEDRLRQRKPAKEGYARVEATTAPQHGVEPSTMFSTRLTSAGQDSTRSAGTATTGSTMSSQKPESLMLDLSELGWGGLNLLTTLPGEGSSRLSEAGKHVPLADSPTQGSYVSYRSSLHEKTDYRLSAALTTDEKYQSAPEDTRDSES